MSGLFRRLSSRRSDGPEGSKPPTAAEPGAADAPATIPAEPGGHRSLLTDPATSSDHGSPYADPAGPTRVLSDAAREPGATTVHQGDATPADPATPEAGAPAPADPVSHAADAPATTTDPASHAADAPATTTDPASHAADAPAPAGVVPGPATPVGPAPFAAPAAYAPAGYALPADPALVPVADLPAGLDPDELAAVPATSARRGKLRRRVGFLRAARELLLRDLGGFVYELHRTAHDIEAPAHRQLRETKLTRLSRVDAELHALEMRLDDVRRQVVVREPGVGGECPRCGELFGSDARYCAHCGLPLTESARRELARAREPAPAPDPVIVPIPDPVIAPAPEIAPAPVADQPTQEISPQDPDHPGSGGEFLWPRRDNVEAAPAAETAQDAATSDAAAEPAAEPDDVPAPEAAPDAHDAPAEDATTELASPDAATEPQADPGDPARPDGEARNGVPSTRDDSILRRVERRP